MNTLPLSEARDNDLRLSQAALERAAQRARALAAQTGTALIVSRNGVVERIPVSVTNSKAPAEVRESRPPYGDGE